MDSWVKSLLHAAERTPQNIKIWHGANPNNRFAIYRNNVMASLIEGLADTFPIIKCLVGDLFFNAMAAEFIRQHPPTSPVLANYGRHFSKFIEGFTPASELPYLVDMAVLEFAYVQAFHAADSEIMAVDKWSALMEDTTKLPDVSFRFHPSMQILVSNYAIASLWSAHQEKIQLNEFTMVQAEQVWIFRNTLSVEILKMGAGDCQFLKALMAGQHLAMAAENVESTQTFDLARCLSIFIQKNIITSFTYN